MIELLFLLFLIPDKILPSTGYAIFEVEMVEFTNPSGLTIDGQSCDTVCQNKFTFCLDEVKDPPNLDTSTCRYDQFITSEFFASNDVTFGSDMEGIMNPLRVNITGTEAGIVLKVRITNGVSSDIDTMRQNLPVSNGRTARMAQWNSYSLDGERSQVPTTLSVRHRSYCGQNYYTETCGVHCAAKDSLDEGHYTCDLMTGKKICLTGWYWPATSCKTRHDPCTELTCKNLGVCLGANGTYTCDCEQGYTGQHCESDFDPCDSKPCSNGATCQSSGNQFTCLCNEYYTGTLCKTQIDLCQPSPCQNAGNCSTSDDTYECTCPETFTGKNCESEFDPCTPNQCENEGVCRPQGVQYECLCTQTYRGARCELEAEVCTSASCSNGGTCTLGSDYKTTCTCPSAYTGTRCELPIQVCTQASCNNGGICTLGTDFKTTCTCSSAYTGSTCENAAVEPVTPIQSKSGDCQEDNTCTEKDMSNVWIGVGVGIGLLVLIVVLLVVIVMKKKGRDPSVSENKEPQPERRTNAYTTNSPEASSVGTRASTVSAINPVYDDVNDADVVLLSDTYLTTPNETNGTMHPTAEPYLTPINERNNSMQNDPLSGTQENGTEDDAPASTPDDGGRPLVPGGLSVRSMNSTLPRFNSDSESMYSIQVP